MTDPADPRSSASASDTSDPTPDASTRVERVLDYVAGEPMLWPIAVVVLGHLAAFVAPALILALRERRGSAMAAVALLVVFSFSAIRAEWLRKGHPAAQSLVIALAWTLSVAAALAAHHLGVF